MWDNQSINGTFFWYISWKKLPTETQKFRELSTPGAEPQTYDDLKKVLVARCHALEAATILTLTTPTQRRLHLVRTVDNQYHQKVATTSTSQLPKSNASVAAALTSYTSAGSSRTSLSLIERTLSSWKTSVSIAWKQVIDNKTAEEQSATNATSSIIHLFTCNPLDQLDPSTKTVEDINTNRANEQAPAATTLSPPENQLIVTLISEERTGNTSQQTEWIFDSHLGKWWNHILTSKVHESTWSLII